CAHKDFQIWAVYGKWELRLLLRKSVVALVNAYCSVYSGPRSIGEKGLSSSVFAANVSTDGVPLSIRRIPNPPSSPPVPLASALVWKPMKYVWGPSAPIIDGARRAARDVVSSVFAISEVWL